MIFVQAREKRLSVQECKSNLDFRLGKMRGRLAALGDMLIQMSVLYETKCQCLFWSGVLNYL